MENVGGIGGLCLAVKSWELIIMKMMMMAPEGEAEIIQESLLLSLLQLAVHISPISLNSLKVCHITEKFMELHRLTSSSLASPGLGDTPCSA